MSQPIVNQAWHQNSQLSLKHMTECASIYNLKKNRSTLWNILLVYYAVRHEQRIRVVSLSAKTLVTWSQYHTSWFLYNHYLTISHTTSQPHLPQTPSFPGLLFTHPPLPILFLFYSTQYTVHLHNLVAFLYCSKFFPLGFYRTERFWCTQALSPFTILFTTFCLLFFSGLVYFSGISHPPHH